MGKELCIGVTVITTEIIDYLTHKGSNSELYDRLTEIKDYYKRNPDEIHTKAVFMDCSKGIVKEMVRININLMNDDHYHIEIRTTDHNRAVLDALSNHPNTPKSFVLRTFIDIILEVLNNIHWVNFLLSEQEADESLDHSKVECLYPVYVVASLIVPIVLIVDSECSQSFKEPYRHTDEPFMCSLFPTKYPDFIESSSWNIESTLLSYYAKGTVGEDEDMIKDTEAMRRGADDYVVTGNKENIVVLKREAAMRSMAEGAYMHVVNSDLEKGGYEVMICVNEEKRLTIGDKVLCVVLCVPIRNFMYNTTCQFFPDLNNKKSN